MTLNGVIALILRFSPISITLQADYARVVEDRPIVVNINTSATFALLHSAIV